MPDVILGLDVGSRHVKAAMVQGGKSSRILSTAVFETPTGCRVDGELAETVELSEKLRAFIGGVKTKRLAVCVNSPNIITRKLVLQKMPANEVRAAVEFELLNLFPSIKETHIIAQKPITEKESEVTVLAALCPSAPLDVYADLAARLGLSFEYADVRPNAQVKAISLYEDRERADASASASADGTGLLIDIGAESSYVNVVSRGKLLLSRVSQSGTHAFDTMTAERSGNGTTVEDAERARRSGDFSAINLDVDTLKSIVEYCFGDINTQVRQTMEFCAYDNPEEKITYVSVIGEGGMIPDIDRFFGVMNDLETKPLMVSEHAKSSSYPMLTLAAIGCATRETGDLNFLDAVPGRYGTGGEKTAFFSGGMGRLIAAFSAAVFVLVLAVILSVWYGADTVWAKNETVRINTQLASDTEVSEIENGILEAQNKLSVLDSVTKSMDTGSVEVSTLLNTLATRAPMSLFAITVSAPNKSEVALTGRSSDYGSVSEYALSLRESGICESVYINSISANDTVSGDMRDYSFTMTIKIGE